MVAVSNNRISMVEIFGHRSHAGRIFEVERFGSKMLRIDVTVKTEEGGLEVVESPSYGGASIFSIRPCSRDVALEYNRRLGMRPAPKLLTHPASPPGEERFHDLGEEEDEDLQTCEYCGKKFHISEMHSLDEGGWACRSCIDAANEEVRNCEHEFAPTALAGDRRDYCSKCGAEKERLIELGMIPTARSDAAEIGTAAPPLAETLTAEIERVEEIRRHYVALRGMPGVNVEPALMLMDRSLKAARIMLAGGLLEDAATVKAAIEDLRGFND